MELTSGAKIIIKALKDHGFEGYAVGGFVRNILLGIPVLDVDVTTSATPDQVIEVFKDYKVYLTGLKHGTVTVSVDGENIEVTTYRIDGEYTDSRHPDTVKFVSDIKGDLLRRDFTVNAMAFDGENLIDLYGGQDDLKNKIIRAVGEPSKRFQEDALRILRALRFSSVLDFEIDKATADAMLENKHLLKSVSIERVFSELNKILLGRGVERVLSDYREIIFEVIPELKDCSGFNQNSKFHAYDVYIHTVKSVAISAFDRSVRWALLFHDIEKPSCYTEDGNGVGHFYGHQKKSADTAVKILKRLKADNELISNCYQLISLHDCKTEVSRGEIKKLLNIYGVKIIKKLIDVKLGDALSHASPYAEIRKELVESFSATLDDILKNEECFTLKRLKIDGNDVKAKGYSGADIKRVLNAILNDVMFGRVQNEKQALLKRLEDERSIRK